MWYWPNLQLTEYEKEFCSMYKIPAGKPGVLRRIYRLQLASIAQPEQNIPLVSTIAKIQIARRSRIFGITFSGNLDSWRLSVKNTNGTQYTNPTPRTNLFPVVSSLIAGSLFSAAALGSGLGTPALPIPLPLPVGANPQPQSFGPAAEFSGQTIQTRQNFPWLIEPNWVCQANETIIFEGADISPTYVIQGETPIIFRLPQILNIAYYAWEFPGMGK